MKSLLYTVTTDAGTFWIRPEPAGRVRLGIDGLELKSYPSAKAAARAVAERSTGFQTWDGATTPAPSGLERWRRGSGHGSGRQHAHRKDVDRLATQPGDDLEGDR